MEGVLINSGASCNLIDYETCNSLKQKHVKCESKQADKKLFAYGQKEPIEVAGTFVSEIVCEATGERCVDGAQVCSVATEGSDTDIREGYADILTGVGKLKDYQLKLHINKDVKPVAQPVQSLPFGLSTEVSTTLASSQR